jgi:hypothetical protein
MPTLSSYSNVFNTCLLILREKGWRFWVDGKGKPTEAFWAEKDGWDLVGYSPVELLGLVAIFERKNPKTPKDYWWREEGPILKLPTKAPKYRRVRMKAIPGR